MKKVTILNICIIALFFVFEALVYFKKLGAFGAWAAEYEGYIAASVVLSMAILTFAWYLRCRIINAKQRGQAGAATNGPTKFSFKKAKRNFWRDTVPLIIFLLITQMIMYAHLDKSLSLLLTIGVSLFYMVAISLINLNAHRYDKLKEENAIRDRENLSLKLRSIRSQLNPHFMFNALTSIQNLINKNDIAAANHYLSIFADLTRKVLNTTDQDLISISEELKIQDDYLQMEQLRFGFKYNVQVSEAINKDNTEIPAMLLQPFVENAVKHGMAANRQNGMINLTIDKQKNNLILSVADNGNGFDKQDMDGRASAFGLKLSRERIELLNQLQPDQPVMLDIDSTPTGTRVTVTLTDLFA